MATSSDVLDHHLKCFGESDLAGIMTDYSSDAVLFMPSGPFKGPEAIASVLKTFMTEFSKPGSSFSLQQKSVEGDYVYILWSGETADNSYELATDTFVILNGKIVAQSFAAKVIPKR
jgi:ketosteroid isomerase-like protein